MFENIEDKYKDLIEVAKEYMNKITDSEHDVNHMNDVVMYTKKILENMDNEVDKEVCIIGAYWHDVGRTKIQEGHEKESIKMLKETMKKMNYDEKFIKKCSDAIEFHKWNMTPNTKEGRIVKDADKIAWLGTGRWVSCIENKQRIDQLIQLLPKLKEDILYFDYSKKIYDEEILKIVKILYDEIYKNI